MIANYVIAVFSGGPMSGQRRQSPPECARLGLDVIAYDASGNHGSYVTLRDQLDRPAFNRFGELVMMWCGFHGRAKQ